MASIDKVKVGETTYDVSPSKDGTLNGYTSSDGTSPTSWSDTVTITTSDTNATIFSKLTSMVRNVRWLYAKLGTEDFSSTGSDTVSEALSGLQSELEGKSNSTHSHGTDTLPVSNNQVNSVNYVPTSALLFSMSQRADGIESIVGIAKRVLDDPNKRYSSTNLGTFAAYDVDMMLSEYTHENNYGDLALGNYFTIQDGTYNAVWEIAGFDMECMQTAADGTIYDNGYGICLIPKTQVTTGKWNALNTAFNGYKSSYMHKTVLPGIITKLKTVLGDHIVNRNVLLSSNVTGNNSSAYKWTTAYATLMSIGQVTGNFASHNTKYDDGEANYKLPVFDYEEFKTGSYFWSRGVFIRDYAWYVVSDGNISTNDASKTYGVRPLIYIR